ncbi:hypothetical protein [Urechidicola vernalis]|uniref:Uncharacterized protein n=1 Tax=Urechidicola vernalis TaxID=3075600 RepID=A0ABU2Y2N6_9FLAO|nr:hypothetical protein [Urechidicola sp. P050]MDT0552469.1 hypothetical protein [Urechidicola sp. P050]
MKYATILLTLVALSSYAQNTEVYIFDISIEQEFVMISNGKNVSNNPGYDSQPSFIDNNTLVFSSTNNDQTDIALYNIKKDKKRWVQETQSSEFSPTKVINEDAISLIKQGLDNTQKLYKYGINDSTQIALVEDLIVGYHTWINGETAALAILENNGLSLNIYNTKTKENETVVTNIGRSLHKIPKSDLISYIDKSEPQWKIMSFNTTSKSSDFIINVIESSEDVFWTSKGILVTGVDNKIYKFEPNKDEDWVKIGTLKDESLTNITRISINNDTSKLAIVVDNK